MLSSLCYKFGQDYQGFRPATQQYLSGFEGASTPFESLSVDQEDDGLRLIREYTPMISQRQDSIRICLHLLSSILTPEQYPRMTHSMIFEVEKSSKNGGTDADTWAWIDVVYVPGYIEQGLSQVGVNYKRQSTVG